MVICPCNDVGKHRTALSWHLEPILYNFFCVKSQPIRAVMWPLRCSLIGWNFIV